MAKRVDPIGADNQFRCDHDASRRDMASCSLPVASSDHSSPEMGCVCDRGERTKVTEHI